MSWITPQLIVDVYHKRGETRLIALSQPAADVILHQQELYGDREVAARLLAFEIMHNPEDMDWDETERVREKRDTLETRNGESE